MTQKHIILITPGQPSTNPRLLKEAISLKDAGYRVSVIFSSWASWADAADNKIFKDHGSINWIRVGGHPRDSKLEYLISRIGLRIFKTLYRIYPSSNSILSYSINRTSYFQVKKALAIQGDLYLAHNLSALPAAVLAAKKHKSKAGFDAEDFHRGESAEGSRESELAKKVEDKFLPEVKHMTAASPMIAARYATLFPSLEIKVINNVFSKKFLQPLSINNYAQLTLFWFSQTVGEKRGLEEVVDALNKLPEYNIVLYTLGDCSEPFRNFLKSISHNPEQLVFLDTVPLEKIFQTATAFDVGLATEIPYCENRNICLTNKIFSYLLAGNCVLASDTAAQSEFFNENPGIGILYKNGDVSDLAEKLEYLYLNRGVVKQSREASHEKASTTYNWELESLKFLKSIHSLFTS